MPAKTAEGRARKAQKDADTVALEKRLSAMRSGLRVTIDHRNNGGVVHIRYRDLEQLDEMVKRLDRRGRRVVIPDASSADAARCERRLRASASRLLRRAFTAITAARVARSRRQRRPLARVERGIGQLIHDLQSRSRVQLRSAVSTSVLREKCNRGKPLIGVRSRPTRRSPSPTRT